MILHFDEKTFDEAVNGDKAVLVDSGRRGAARAA